MTTDKSDFEMIRHAEGWVSASPVPTPGELQQFYAGLYYQQPQSTTYQEAYDDLELRYRRLKCDALLHALRQQGMSTGSDFLDIGAGEGFLLDAAHRSGLSVTGIDFSAFAIQKFFPGLRDRLIAGDLFDTIERLSSEGRRFAACSALNVFEHVIDPGRLLASIRHVLDPGGILAITVPNDFSRLQDLLRKDGFVDRDFWWAPPQHLHYFNSENIVSFCASRGYRLVDAFSDFPIDLYLLHPGSNYVMNAANGSPAHRARLLHDLLIAEAGLAAYLAFYRAMFNVGIGRDVTVVVRPATA
jgi:SAM-dependent methyltransferase